MEDMDIKRLNERIFTGFMLPLSLERDVSERFYFWCGAGVMPFLPA